MNIIELLKMLSESYLLELISLFLNNLVTWLAADLYCLYNFCKFTVPLLKFHGPPVFTITQVMSFLSILPLVAIPFLFYMKCCGSIIHGADIANRDVHIYETYYNLHKSICFMLCVPQFVFCCYFLKCAREHDNYTVTWEDDDKQIIGDPDDCGGFREHPCRYATINHVHRRYLTCENVNDWLFFSTNVLGATRLVIVIMSFVFFKFVKKDNNAFKKAMGDDDMNDRL